MDPMSSFVRSMSATSQMIRGANQDKRADQVHGMRMDAYDRQTRREDETEERRGNVRDATARLTRLQNGGLTGADVADYDHDAGFSMAEFDQAFDVDAQNEAMGQVMTSVDKVSTGQPLAQEEMEPIRATAGALSYTGVLQKTVPEIRKQAVAAKGLQAAIVQLSGKAGKPLLGRKTKVDSTTHPELFEMFSQTFPAIKGGSKGFNGDFTPVEFYIDGTGSEDIRDARVIVIGEGVDAQGKTYRAPMSTLRSNDPNDEVVSTPLKELFGRTNYTERMANSFIATIIENDDAAAQASLDRYYESSDQFAQEKKKREQGAQLSSAVGNAAGYSEQERKSMAELVAAGSTAKEAASIIVSARAKVKGGTGGSDGSGGGTVGSKEFHKHITELESLYRARADLEGGVDPFTGEPMAEGVESAALSTINKTIKDRENYMQNTAPQLWSQYRRVQEPVPSSRPSIEGIFGGEPMAGPRPAVAGGANQSPAVPRPKSKSDTNSVSAGIGHAADRLRGVRSSAGRAVDQLQDAGGGVVDGMAYFLKYGQLPKKPQPPASVVDRGVAQPAQAAVVSSPNVEPVASGVGMRAGRGNHDAQAANVGKAIAKGKAGSDEQVAAQVSQGLRGLIEYFSANPGEAKSKVGVAVSRFHDWVQSQYGESSAVTDPQALADFAKADPGTARLIVDSLVRSAKSNI